ncbi:MAG: hypothetical protein KGM44_03680 [bacterium]|nr:hypothetical protein [bacterium]
MTDNDVAALFILVLFGGGIAWAIANRVFAHTERLEMIRHGMVPPPERRLWRAAEKADWSDWASAARTGRWGRDPAAAARRRLHSGVTLTFLGLALTIGLSFIGYTSNGAFGLPGITPGPWLLGGLIPMFVGLAQIVTALLSPPALGGDPGRMRDAAYSPSPGAAEPPAPPPWGQRVNRDLDPGREIPPPGQPPMRP